MEQTVLSTVEVKGALSNLSIQMYAVGPSKYIQRKQHMIYYQNNLESELLQ